jgi:hypothetical protein
MFVQSGFTEHASPDDICTALDMGSLYLNIAEFLVPNKLSSSYQKEENYTLYTYTM